MQYKFPQTSAIIRENISEKSYDCLKDFIKEGDAVKTAIGLSSLHNAADLLQFQKLFTTINIIMLTPLYILPNENDIKKFMEKYSIKDEDFDGEKLIQLVDDNQALYDECVKQYQKDIQALDQLQGIEQDSDEEFTQ
ncbi:hypothetical protein IMG5_155850 [Ichthyophthirius multifiliis]|uniref:Uncharacterized protein n=1 Tax=Ichthyophthirius multifiliis TaxID=5932 RepID=G0QZD2_ICHMU|nr:hypothetical protein IMG5_155850 [Ichthyophthirius multifiliis]EGR29435.1 hypothetical protein IMG5_155850 [Ichthyophthirius multifiliis]|eukprot:XP_004030671.1 hypothetical protein IMG5_155850 [Ichthyophthirius multifiliis]